MRIQNFWISTQNTKGRKVTKGDVSQVKEYTLDFNNENEIVCISEICDEFS